MFTFIRQVISDFQLFAMLGLFITIDLLIVMVWEIIDPLHANEHFTGREVGSASVPNYRRTPLF